MLKFNTEQILLIGNINNFRITDILKTYVGDYLNSPLFSFKIELRFNSLLPSAKLLSNLDNSWFKPNNYTLKDVIVSFDTLLELLEYLNSNEGIKIELLNYQSDIKLFNLLLAMTDEQPFKVSFNSLCLKYKNVIYIIYDTNERTYFRHLISEDLKYTFKKNFDIKNQLSFQVVKAIESIYKHPSLVVLDNGHIAYKGVEYLNHKRIIYSTDFIKNYFLNINW